MRFFAKALFIAAAAAATSGQCAAQETRLLMTSLSPAGSTNSVFFNQWAQKLVDQSGRLGRFLGQNIRLEQFPAHPSQRRL